MLYLTQYFFSYAFNEMHHWKFCYCIHQVFNFLALHNINIHQYRKTFYKQMEDLQDLQELQESAFRPNYFKNDGMTLEFLYWSQRETVPIHQENDQGNGPWLPLPKLFLRKQQPINRIEVGKVVWRSKCPENHICQPLLVGMVYF